MKKRYFIALLFMFIIYVSHTQNVGIGTSNPNAKLEVQGDANSGVSGIKVETNYTGDVDLKAIEGKAIPNPGWGYGGYFTGGYIGVLGFSDAGSYSNPAYGMYGKATGTTGTRYGGFFEAISSGPTINYGIYAKASNATTNWAGYFNGNVNIVGQLKIVDGNQSNGKFLMSNADGLASWSTIPDDGDWAISGDNLYGVLPSHAKIGIGITAPLTKTHIVKNTGQGYPTYSPGTLLAIQQNSDGNWAHIAITAATNGAASLNLGDVNDDDAGSVMYHNSDNSMRFFTNGSEKVRIASNGNIGVGITAPLQKIHIDGYYRSEIVGNDAYWDIGTDGYDDCNFVFKNSLMAYISHIDGAYHAVSDRRLKYDIVDMTSVLQKVKKLKPSNYRFVGTNPNVSVSTGLIAQDVQKLFPETVSKKNDYFTINYDAFSIIAIKAIQEQQSQIEKLISENKLLNDRLTTLEQKIINIEKKL